MIRFALLSLLLAGAAAPAAAQVPEIVVTGQGLAPGRGEPAFDTVTIPRERLVHAPSNRLEEVLREVPGFQLFRRSDARSANPTSQGATLRRRVSDGGGCGSFAAHPALSH